MKSLSELESVRGSIRKFKLSLSLTGAVLTRLSVKLGIVQKESLARARHSELGLSEDYGVFAELRERRSREYIGLKSMTGAEMKIIAKMLGVVAVLLAGPGAAHAGSACVVNSAMVITAGMTISVYKYLATAANCTSIPGAKQASACFPGSPGSNVTTLVAVARTTSTNPVCSWSCACGNVRTDGSDGLPVELLDFDIAGAPVKAAQQAEDSNPKTASRQQ